MTKKLTGADLLAAMEKANEEVHPAQQAYVDGYGDDKNPAEVVLDGRFNLNRIAELLNDG